MKNIKGITLISLIITIIIIVILAGIVLVAIQQTDIIDLAKKSLVVHEKNEIKEILSLKIVDIVLEKGKDILKLENKDEFEKALNENIKDEKDKAKVYYDWEGNNELIDILYKGYLFRVKIETGEIIEIIDVIAYTGNREDLDKLNPSEMSKMAKEIDYKFTTTANSCNVVYSNPDPMKTDKHEGSEEKVWTKTGLTKIKMVVEGYCSNNVMIYDGETAPYVPVMVRFFRANKDTWKELGLKYFIVSEDKMKFSTKNENNDWAFIKENKEYNYDAESDRKCASNATSSTSFKDTKDGDYWASGRLTYIGEPTEMVTNLGGFTATSADHDGKNQQTVQVGSNYLVDVREYYASIQNGKDLLNRTYNTTSISTEYYNLSRAIVNACTFNYEYNYPGKFAAQIEEKTKEINTAIENLNKAINENVPQITDVVLATVEKAQNAKKEISTININGGANIVYSDPNPMKTDKHEGSGEELWEIKTTFTKIKMVVEGYCSNNVMIYDGETAPYVPVMVRFYRANKGTKNLGLKYFIVSEDTMKFSTKNENNDWAFIKENKEYNYDAESDRKCASNATSSTSFKDTKDDDYWASGRLTYIEEPTEMLTNLGGFTATSADQNGENEKTIQVGSNYVIDVREYYNKIEEAKSLLTMDNIFDKSKSETTYNLAKSISEMTEQVYTFSDPQVFANEIKENIEKLNNNIEKLR